MHCLYVCLLVCMYMYVCIYKHTNNACSLRIQYSLNVYVHHVCVCVCVRVSGERRIVTAQQSCACWRLLPYATSRGNHIIGYLTHIHARTAPRTNLTELRAYASTLTPRTRKNTHVRAHEKSCTHFLSHTYINTRAHTHPL